MIESEIKSTKKLFVTQHKVYLNQRSSPFRNQVICFKADEFNVYLGWDISLSITIYKILKMFKVWSDQFMIRRYKWMCLRGYNGRV